MLFGLHRTTIVSVDTVIVFQWLWFLLTVAIAWNSHIYMKTLREGFGSHGQASLWNTLCKLAAHGKRNRAVAAWHLNMKEHQKASGSRKKMSRDARRRWIQFLLFFPAVSLASLIYALPAFIFVVLQNTPPDSFAKSVSKAILGKIILYTCLGSQ